MSYNLLLDTNFTHIDKHWKLTNCVYENGYLKATNEIFSIEQEIILPDPTKLYLSLDYICFDNNIKSIYYGIFTEDGEFKAFKKSPIFKKRKKLSVISKVKFEKIKIMIIVESKKSNSAIYIDSPLLVDLIRYNKKDWPRWILDKYLDYRYGYTYENEYHNKGELNLQNLDFKSITTNDKYNSDVEVVKASTCGIILSTLTKGKNKFKINHDFQKNNYYLIKLDYFQVNNYGEIYLNYGVINSIKFGEDQIYILFKVTDNNINKNNELNLIVENFENLPYIINLKHLLIINLKHMNLNGEDIPYLPFI